MIEALASDSALLRLTIVAAAALLVLCVAIPALLGPRRRHAIERSRGRFRTCLHDVVERGFR